MYGPFMIPNYNAPSGHYFNAVTGDKMRILEAGKVILNLFLASTPPGEPFTITFQDMNDDTGINKINVSCPNLALLAAIVE